MKILFYNPASTQRRFIPFEAIKGSTFFRRPNYDALRLAHLSKGHEYFYYDERIEEKPDYQPDVVVVNVPLSLAYYVESTVRQKWPGKCKIICYGFYPTLFPEQCKKYADSVVIGDIANIWKKMLSDLKHRRLASVYESNRKDQFAVDRTWESKYGFTPVLSQMRTSFGCICPLPHKDFCYENILYKDFVQWDIDKVIEDVAQIRRKIVQIRDDDFLYNLDYAKDVLEKTWRFKKMWIFQTSGDIFKHSEILPLLGDDGTRIIYLKEDWLGHDLAKKINDQGFVREKKHQVAQIHKNRIAVGSLIRLGFEEEDHNFYRTLLHFLVNTRIDFVQICVQTPTPKSVTYDHYRRQDMVVNDLTLFDLWMPVIQNATVEPQALYSWMEWLRDRFYSWDSILLRSIQVSPNLGLYNTVFFYLIPNLSYRNNFLEKVGYPP